MQNFKILFPNIQFHYVYLLCCHLGTSADISVLNILVLEQRLVFVDENDGGYYFR